MSEQESGAIESVQTLGNQAVDTVQQLGNTVVDSGEEVIGAALGVVNSILSELATLVGNLGGKA